MYTGSTGYNAELSLGVLQSGYEARESSDLAKSKTGYNTGVSSEAAKRTGYETRVSFGVPHRLNMRLGCHHGFHKE